MTKFNKFINFVVNKIIFIIIALSTVAFFYPTGFAWMTKYTAIFLGVAMFGMGTTIDYKSMKSIVIHPKEIVIGIVSQFVFMPLIAWGLCSVLNLPSDIALGVILVGCCPGGTASNVMTHIAGGDVALSVTMTTVSTLLAPFLTPVLVYMFAGAWINVSLYAMFITVIKVILIPVVLGIVVNKLAGKKMEYVSPVLPLISSISIILIISGIIAINSDKIIESGALVTMVVFIHNVLGLFTGLGVSKLLGVEYKKATAVAIEVGMQNSGLAVSLATVNFAMNPLATLPGAIFSVMHNLTGSVFANVRRNGAQKAYNLKNRVEI
ncbi:bile acid:sodium symporter family protein [Peptoniphilus asaccharolyticus]